LLTTIPAICEGFNCCFPLWPFQRDRKNLFVHLFLQSYNEEAKESLREANMERRLVVLSGILVGILGVLLVRFGNPLNMGICVACFARDVAGGLGLHRAAVVQYLRPEFAGFILGAFLVALMSGEFRTRGGSSPLLRFFIGMAIMIGALVFLGCPLRMVLRLAGGDLNALVGLFGFISGILVGVFFLRRGFSLGRSTQQSKGNGLLLPVIAVSLVVLVLAAPPFIFFSESGPGALRAPVFISLIAGLLVGVAVQRSRLCMAGGIRDLALLRDPHLFWGSLAIFVVALAGNLGMGLFNLGFANQPVAHTDGVWNFLGLAVVGLGATLLGGCPLRQTIMAGEGDSDAGLTVLGMIGGGAVSHNFGLAASPAGVGVAGQWGLLVTIVFLLATGFAFSRAEIIHKGGFTHEQSGN
jgi:uncharacterized protein